MFKFKVKTPKSEIYFAVFILSFFIAIFGGGSLIFLDCGGPFLTCVDGSKNGLSTIGLGVFFIGGMICIISGLLIRQDKEPDDVSSHTPLG